MSSTSHHRDPSYTTIGTLVKKWARTDPETPAFIFVSPSWRLSLSRADVLRLASRCAAILHRQGVRQGDVVCNTLPNSPERLLTDLGIMLAGGVAMNGQVFLKDGDDLVGSIKAAGCVGIVLDPLVPQGAAWLLKQRKHVVQDDGKVHYPEMPTLKMTLECSQRDKGDRKAFLDVLEEETEALECEQTTPEDTVVVWTTSGSTGFSKLVPLSHHKVLLFSNTYYNLVDLRPGEMFYNDRPLGWAGGFMNCYLTHGATRVMVDFSRETVDDQFAFVWDVLRRERCKVAFFVPYYIEKLVENYMKRHQGEKTGESPGKSSAGDSGESRVVATAWKLRILACGGQPLKTSHLAALGTITDAIRIAYGATETGLMAWRHIDDASTYESCNNGRPVPGMQVKVVDDAEQEVGVGQMGQIIIKSEQAFLGYLNDDVSTQKTFTSDGWIRTGDMGYLNDKGEVFTVCRKAFSIIRGAHLVYPGWLETRIARYPGVQNVLVVPVPDPVLHQELCACVVTLPGAEVTVEGLREYCRSLFLTDEKDHMTAVPKYYLFFDTLPTNTTGKTCRRSTTLLARQRLGLTDD
nr:hypothetical protein BaRGS_026285 [Batillaria attramentaria]